MAMDVNADAPRNALSPMLVNWEPTSNITEVKLVAKTNAFESMTVTPDGMVIEVKLVALWNACCPMLFQPVPKVTFAGEPAPV